MFAVHPSIVDMLLFFVGYRTGPSAEWIDKHFRFGGELDVGAWGRKDLSS